MGNDYEQRKQSKKRKRSNINPQLASEGGKKERKKRSAIRRLCRGMCYNEPSKAEASTAVTDEDMAWTGATAEEEPVSASERRLAQAAITELNKTKAAEKEKRELAKAKRKRRKLSTDVDLISPDAVISRATARAEVSAAQLDQLGSAMAEFPETMRQYMAQEGFVEPTPIQERCWPLCLEGRDVAAAAEPGSGKTLGYLLPVVPLLQAHKHGAESTPGGPVVLILVPTRELAQQVAMVGRTLRKLFGLRTLCIYGGADRDAQVEGLKKLQHIVVATPGRLLDLHDEGAINLDEVRCVVLDEADKMLSLGLQPQLDRLRAALLPKKSQKPLPGPVVVPESRRQRPQVLLFTATMTEEAQEMAKKWLRKPAQVHVGVSAANISRTVVQVVHVCAEHKKPQKLLKHLAQMKEKSIGARHPPRVLIFANRVKTVRFVHQTVAEAGFKTAILHGDRSQQEREEAMRDFRSGKAQVLVATDVASRGLHVHGLPYVINYDFPSRLEAYIHRAGRTGRIAAHGHCYSFFTRNMAPLAQPLLELLQEHEQTIDPNLVQLAEAYTIASQKLQAADGAVEEGSNMPLRAAAAVSRGEDSKGGDDLALLADLFGDGSKTDTATQPADEAGEEAMEDDGRDTGAAMQDGLLEDDDVPAKKEGSRSRSRGLRVRKAVPGRLRKKLAKAKAASDG